MKNILLLTDFSDNSMNAIEYAIKFFKNSECNFFLLHVNRLNVLEEADTPYITNDEVINEVYIKPAKTQLRNILKRILKIFPNNNNHRYYTLTDYSFFIESIRKHVVDRKIDMIVMGTKGSSGLKKYIIGSNTGDVITKVKCAILVIPENAKFSKIKEIAFPTDFALNYNLNTLQPISEILEAYNSYLGILHISQSDKDLNTDQQKNKELLDDYFNNRKHGFYFLTNKKIENAIQCFVESRGVDLITMVAKNLNYFQRLLFLPKVKEISYHTDIPFLVLHE